ncbi:MAG TPA: DUF1501 domain-containing protein [Tepidisphaeraceae bacterium]
MSNPFSRRSMLQSAACGFGYLAFADLLTRAYAAEQASQGESHHYESPLKPRAPHFAAKAKRVIFLFMQGAPSHVDTFDYKPELVSSDGKNVGGRTILAPQWKFKQYGKSGLWISDLFPSVAQHADDLCLVNSMFIDNPAHPQATIQLHTGSARFVRPSMGSWVVYGLGTENQNLPGFITINPPAAVGGAQNYGASFLPAAFEGTPISGNAREGLPNIAPAVAASLQRRQIDLVQSMNREMLRRSGGENPQIEGIIESFELGFRMQSTVPDVMDLSKESKQTLEMYGIGDDETETFGRQCLMARRFAEAGVRFIEIAYTGWDQHTALHARHAANAKAVDKPIAGLLADLKRRRMLDDTLVIWGGEFGRTPTAQNRDGRDHNNRGYTMWMAGGGVKGGLRFGATDEIGARAEQDKVHVHDLHATILHLLGLDHERLTYRYAGRDFRLTEVYGNVVKGILA